MVTLGLSNKSDIPSHHFPQGVINKTGIVDMYIVYRCTIYTRTTEGVSWAGIFKLLT